MATLGSSRTLAGLSASGKKRQPARSSSLSIFSRAVASFMFYVAQERRRPPAFEWVLRSHSKPPSLATRPVQDLRRGFAATYEPTVLLLIR